MKMCFLCKKAFCRSGAILSEFISLTQHYSLRLAVLTLAWWMGNYLRLSGIKRLFDKKKQREIDRIIALKCGDLIEKYQDMPESAIVADDYRIWVFWAQGVDNMPPLVRRCYEQMRHVYGEKLIALDLNNVSDYVDIPGFIYEFLHQGKLLHAHFSDILRNSLIAEYGGLWLDSTCWISMKIPEDYKQLNFFSVNDSYTGTKWVSYAMGSGVKGNITSSFVRDALIRFAEFAWPDYLLQDRLIAFAYKNIVCSKNAIDAIPTNNMRRMELFAMMNEPFDRNWYHELTSDSWIFKLSYKAYYKQETSTLYWHIMQNIF